MQSRNRLGLFGGLLLAAMSFGASAEIKLPQMFSDRAVLQRGIDVPVWGWAEAGEKVTVVFGGQEKVAEVQEDGSWRVEFAPMKANSIGRTMTISGSVSERVLVSDVLVGEVWMASGQSNMQWDLTRTDGAKEEIASANHPELRMFLTSLETASEPQSDLSGVWLTSTPANAGKFSAVGYYFGKRLNQELNVPVGIIRSAWGGKPSEAFTTKEKLASHPEGKMLVDDLEERMQAYDPEVAKLNHEKAIEAWNAKVEEIKEENAALVDAERVAAEAEGREVKPVKQQKIPRWKPVFQEVPNLMPNSPQAIYNAMIHPWVGYEMRGAIWYQGESNRKRAKQYETIFPLMIEDWRERWGKQFSFYWAQLANFQKPTDQPGIASDWAELQNAQRLTLSLPKTGMAVLNDIGAANDIHPRNKRDVGERLGRWALVKDYGREDVVVSGPIYQAHSVEGNQIRVTFEYAEGLKSRDGKPLARFEIAGEDRQWHWGEAKIEGQSVIVSSPAVLHPVAVRYAWASNPTGANLVNGADLPTSVFRTDDWKLSTEK